MDDEDRGPRLLDLVDVGVLSHSSPARGEMAARYRDRADIAGLNVCVLGRDDEMFVLLLQCHRCDVSLDERRQCRPFRVRYQSISDCSMEASYHMPVPCID